MGDKIVSSNHSVKIYSGNLEEEIKKYKHTEFYLYDRGDTSYRAKFFYD